MSFDALEILGLTEVDLVAIQGQRLRPEVIPALQQLQSEAVDAGFDLTIASGFRSYSRQQKIWDEKACGLRPLLDDFGNPLCFEQLSTEQLLFAILRWSALPGASRHHWGTDFDVFDQRALPAGQAVQLTFAETVEGGVFAPLHRWLDERLRQPDCPFFRPYIRPTGGVAPEPWHLSYAPLSAEFQRRLNFDTILAVIQNSDIALKEEVLVRLPEIFDRFIWVPWLIYPQQFQMQK